MKKDDRVTKEKVLKHTDPIGKVLRVAKDYIVVKWDNIPGDWHYTHEQSNKLKIIKEKEE
jgi:hypothetical protein